MKLPFAASFLACALAVTAWAPPAVADEVSTPRADAYVPIEARYPVLRLGFGGMIGYGGIRQMTARGVLFGVQGRAGLQIDPRNAVFWEVMPVFSTGRNGSALGVDNLAVYEHAFGRFLMGVGLGANIAGYL